MINKKDCDALSMKGLQRYEPAKLPEVIDNNTYFWVVWDHAARGWVAEGAEFKTEADCQKECDRLNQEDSDAKA